MELNDVQPCMVSVWTFSVIKAIKLFSQLEDHPNQTQGPMEVSLMIGDGNFDLHSSGGYVRVNMHARYTKSFTCAATLTGKFLLIIHHHPGKILQILANYHTRFHPTASPSQARTVPKVAP